MKILPKLRKPILFALFCIGIAGIGYIGYSWTFGYRGDINYFKRQTGMNLSRFNNVKFFENSGFRGGYVEATCQIPLNKIDDVIQQFGFIQYDPTNLNILFKAGTPSRENRFANFQNAPEDCPPPDKNVYFVPQQLAHYGKSGFVAHHMVLEKDTGTFWGKIIFK